MPTRLAVPVLALAYGIAAAPALEAQQTYTLRCNLRTELLTVRPSGFSMQFKGATAGFKDRAPMDGECAWYDRGWNADEPERLIWGNNSWGTFGELEGVLGSIQLDHNNVVVDRIWSSRSSRAPTPLTTPIYFRNPAYSLFDMVMGEWETRGIIEFQAYRDGTWMRITEARTVGQGGRWIGPFD